MPQDIREHSGISKLHEDILLELFRLCHDTDMPEAMDWDAMNLRLKYALGWVRLSHVSSAWRKIIHAASFLWADLVCALPPAADVAVARARDCPLILDDGVHLPFNMAYEDKCYLRERIMEDLSFAPYLSRAVRLHQRKVGCDWANALARVTFPHLRDLHLVQNRPYPRGPVLIDAPELQSVTLRRLPAIFTATSIRTLTLYGGDELLPTIGCKLIETINTLTLLEVLSLTLVPTGPVQWSGPNASRARLDNLTSIVLRGTLTADLESFWHYLDCPCSVALEFDLLDGYKAGWRSCVNTFAPHLSRQDCLGLEIRLSSFDINVDALSFITRKVLGDEREVSSVVFRIDKHDNSETKAIISAFAYQLERHFDAIGVDLDVRTRIDGISFYESMSAFSSATHIMTYRVALMQDLLTTSSSSSSPAEDGCCFPSLGTITVGLNFRDVDAIEAVQLQEQCEGLLAIVRSRHSLGRPISKVHLFAPYTTIEPKLAKAALDTIRELIYAFDNKIQLHAHFVEQ